MARTTGYEIYSTGAGSIASGTVCAKDAGTDGVEFTLEVIDSATTHQGLTIKERQVRYRRICSYTENGTGLSKRTFAMFGTGDGIIANTGNRFADASESGYWGYSSDVPDAIKNILPASCFRDDVTYNSVNGAEVSRVANYYCLFPSSIKVTSGNVYDGADHYDTDTGGYVGAAWRKFWPTGSLFGRVQAYEENIDVDDLITNPSNGTVTSTDSSGDSTSGKTYSSDEYITLTATPDEGYTFKKWSNEATDNPLTIKISDIPSTGIWPIFQSLWHNFILSKQGNGNGSYSATIDGIEVEDADEFRAKEGSTVVLTATPESDDYVVKQWSVSGAVTESSSVEVSVTDDMQTNVYCIVTINNPSKFDLEISKDNPSLGTIEVSGNDTVYTENSDGEIEERLLVGVNYEFKATVIEPVKNRFLGWYENNALVSTANPYTLCVSESTARTFVAKFEVIPYFKCVVEKLQNASTDDIAEVEQCNVALTPTPDANFDGFDRWLSTTMYATATNSTKYLLKKWTVEDLDGGDNGFDNPEEGSVTGVQNPLSFTLDFNAKIKAYFGRGIFYAHANVYAESAGGGTCSVASLTQGHDCDSLVNGDQVTFTATAADGFIFSRWQNASGVSVSTSASFTVTIADADLDYYAVFIDSEFGPSAVQKWNSGTTNRMLTWRSKVYASSQPTSPVTLRVDSKFYPVLVKIGTFSSPDAATEDGGETRYVNLTISDQNARRLPALRPERYVVIQLRSRGEVDAVYLGTSMIGIAG